MVTTAAALNYETCSFYNLQVKATSADGSVCFSSFGVSVSNVNEAPVISSAGGGATGSVSVNANTLSVMTVAAKDPDAGSVLRYSISGGADAASFVIDGITGALKFAGNAGPYFAVPTDVGGNNVYDVQVKVSDASGAFDTQDLAVQVTQTPGLTKSANNFLLNILYGGSGNDTLSTNGALDFIYAQGGNDTLSAGLGLRLAGRRHRQRHGQLRQRPCSRQRQPGGGPRICGRSAGRHLRVDREPHRFSLQRHPDRQRAGQPAQRWCRQRHAHRQRRRRPAARAARATILSTSMPWATAPRLR